MSWAYFCHFTVLKINLFRGGLVSLQKLGVFLQCQYLLITFVFLEWLPTLLEVSVSPEEQDVGLPGYRFKESVAKYKTNCNTWVTLREKWIAVVSMCTGFRWDGVSFFIAAHVMLCFRFGTNAKLMAHWCFSCCLTVFAQHKSHLSFSLCAPHQMDCKCTWGWSGTQPGRQPELIKGILHTVEHHIQ